MPQLIPTCAAAGTAEADRYLTTQLNKSLGGTREYNEKIWSAFGDRRRSYCIKYGIIKKDKSNERLYPAQSIWFLHQIHV
ncbi:MAG: hypothetical protein AB4426_35175 [Xenococcaceae cyanobacterium]